MEQMEGSAVRWGKWGVFGYFEKGKCFPLFAVSGTEQAVLAERRILINMHVAGFA
jgi:hypothetical protein